jgi:hypothetical protein
MHAHRKHTRARTQNVTRNITTTTKTKTTTTAARRRRDGRTSSTLRRRSCISRSRRASSAALSASSLALRAQQDGVRTGDPPHNHNTHRTLSAQARAAGHNTQRQHGTVEATTHERTRGHARAVRAYTHRFFARFRESWSLNFSSWRALSAARRASACAVERGGADATTTGIRPSRGRMAAHINTQGHTHAHTSMHAHTHRRTHTQTHTHTHSQAHAHTPALDPPQSPRSPDLASPRPAQPPDRVTRIVTHSRVTGQITVHD